MSNDRGDIPPEKTGGGGKKKPPRGDYEVGYGKPPKSGQFKPGRSGNVSGRRRKVASAIDIDDILDRPVAVASGGKLKAMEPKKVTLLAQIKKAKDGNQQALAHVLDKFVKHGVLGSRKKKAMGGVLALPTSMPFAMARIIAQRFGRPPWTKAQIAKGREEYLSARSEGEAREDEATGYEDL